MSLQILQWLPSILWDLSFCVGVPSMFTYGPEVYELHPWGSAGDSRFNLDTDTHAINLLTQKLAELRDGAGSDKVPPSRGPSPTGSTALQCTASSLARSHSVTPSHRMSLVRSCSNSTSSTSSHDSTSDSPMASDHKGPYRRSTSPEGDGSDNNSVANSAGDTPIADEHPDSDDPTVAVPNTDDTEKLAVMRMGPPPLEVTAPQNLR